MVHDHDTSQSSVALAQIGRQIDPVHWILSKFRVINIAVIICVLVPCFALNFSAAEEGPEAVVQLFYKALREGKEDEARTYLSRESHEYIENNPVNIAHTLTNNGTLQTVVVSGATKFSVFGVEKETRMVSVVTRFEDGSSQKLRILLIKEGEAWKLLWIGEINEEQAFQDYVVRSYHFFYPAFSQYGGYIEILKAGHRVYRSPLTYIYGGFTLFNYRWDRKKKTMIKTIVVPMGTDLTGNGTPNLVVKYFSGGSGGYGKYFIFEIGQEFRKIAIIGDHVGTRFADLDGDSKLEIVVRDNSFYSFNCNACYPRPDVVLRYQDGAYRIAVDLMRKPAPSRKDLEERSQQVQENTFEYWQKNGWVPEHLLATMLELLYTGHPDLAWEFVEMAWPPGISGKDDFISRFRAMLRGSRYWPLDSNRAYFVP